MLDSMADVAPFRALRYDPSLDLAAVICPPFDTISPEQQAELYARSGHNAVRIELAQTSGPGRYENAATALREWMAANVLRRDSVPSYYLYDQSFPYGDRTYTRQLLFAALRVVPWDAGEVLPHEQTFGAPKEDRIQLMRAAHINGSPIFLFYRDADGRIRDILRDQERQNLPLFEFETADGHRHRLVRIDEPEGVVAVREEFAGETLYIADGHHRYETALAYRDEVRAAAGEWTGDEPENFALVGLVAEDDPGMLVLPIHRITASGADWPTVRARLEELFDLAPTTGDGGDVASILATKPGAFGFAVADAETPFILTPKDRDALDEALPQDRSAGWRSLDYSVCNHAIMRRCLGLTDDQMRDYSTVWFSEDAREAFGQVQGGRARYAVVLNPLPVSRVLEMADAGERMPQKSTFFYPKIPSGLVFNLLEA